MLTVKAIMIIMMMMMIKDFFQNERITDSGIIKKFKKLFTKNHELGSVFSCTFTQNLVTCYVLMQMKYPSNDYFFERKLQR